MTMIIILRHRNNQQCRFFSVTVPIAWTYFCSIRVILIRWRLRTQTFILYDCCVVYCL